MIRLFVGLDFPSAVRARLAGLCGGLPTARWVEAQNLHLTLRFIGPVDGATAGDIDHALDRLSSVPAFSFTLDGVGTFGRGKHPHTLWVGTAPSLELAHLHRKIDSALVRQGIAPDPRQFTPHVTLARLSEGNGKQGKGNYARGNSERLHSFLAGNNLFNAGPVSVSSFVLFSSHPGGNYREEARYDLKPGLFGEEALTGDNDNERISL